MGWVLGTPAAVVAAGVGIVVGSDVKGGEDSSTLALDTCGGMDASLGACGGVEDSPGGGVT